MKLLDGKHTADVLKKEIAQQVAQQIAKGGKQPHLAAILVGHDPASETYVGNKEKACARVGMLSTVFRFEADVSERELLDCVARVNADADIDGLIVQLPLPKSIDAQKIIEAVDPKKDVDGFHPVNVGRMLLGMHGFVSATPAGIMTLLSFYDITTRGKHCTILGRSNIVGRPLANLLSQKGKQADCTVTLCHSRTADIKGECLQADILVAAIGQPEFVKADMVRKGAVVIDVGMNRVACAESKTGYRLTGDVDFAEVAPKCSYITPVPGGVGPMTIVSLLQNTLKASKI